MARAPASLACRAGSGYQTSSQMSRPSARAVDVDDARGVPRLEIALLVEHRVVRQPLLAIDRADATVAQHRERVVAAAAVTLGKADDDGRAPERRGQRGQLGRAGVEERRPQHEILGRVSAQREFGRHDEPRAGALCLRRRAAYRGGVARQIAENLIQLGYRDLHGFRAAKRKA